MATHNIIHCILILNFHSRCIFCTLQIRLVQRPCFLSSICIGIVMLNLRCFLKSNCYLIVLSNFTILCFLFSICIGIVTSNLRCYLKFNCYLIDFSNFTILFMGQHHIFTNKPSSTLTTAMRFMI